MDQSVALSVPRQDTAAARDVEAEWIEAARTTPAAFEPLYLRYRERIHHYVRLRLTSDEDAADATQEVFLQALKALPHYQPRASPWPRGCFGSRTIWRSTNGAVNASGSPGMRCRSSSILPAGPILRCWSNYLTR